MCTDMDVSYGSNPLLYLWEINSEGSWEKVSCEHHQGKLLMSICNFEMRNFIHAPADQQKCKYKWFQLSHVSCRQQYIQVMSFRYIWRNQQVSNTKVECTFSSNALMCHPSNGKCLASHRAWPRNDFLYSSLYFLVAGIRSQSLLHQEMIMWVFTSGR